MTDKRPTRRVILDLDQETFELLEVVVFAKALEHCKTDEEKKQATEEIFSAKKNDFGPGVTEFLNDIANSLSAGVFRAGCWERGCLESLTGWFGEYYPTMLGPLAKKEKERWDEIYESRKVN